MIYHIFHNNPYDGMDYRGEYEEHELKAMLNGTQDDRGIGYDKIDILDTIIIKGTELGIEELNKIKGE